MSIQIQNRSLKLFRTIIIFIYNEHVRFIIIGYKIDFTNKDCKKINLYVIEIYNGIKIQQTVVYMRFWK